MIVLGLTVFRASGRLAAEPAAGSAETTLISIEAERGAEGTKWIRSDTELVRRYPIALRELRSVLEDFEAYPGFMPRLTRTTVLARGSASVTIRQRYEIVILGYRFPTEYDLTLAVYESDLPDRWVLSWSLAGSDGSIGASSGSWTLEAEEEGPLSTKIVHRNVGLVKKRFPLQLGIMRAVAAKELGRTLEAIFTEAVRRETELARSDSPARRNAEAASAAILKP